MEQHLNFFNFRLDVPLILEVDTKYYGQILSVNRFLFILLARNLLHLKNIRMKALMSMVRVIMMLLCVFSHSSVGTRVEPADDRQDHDNGKSHDDEI